MNPLPSDTFPFNRSNQTGLIPFVWKQFKRRWLLLTASAYLLLSLSLGFALVGPVLGMLFSVPFVSLNAEPGTSAMVASLAGQAIGGLFSLTMTGVMVMGFSRLAWGVLHDEPAGIGMLFSQFHKTGRFLRLVGTLFVLGGGPVLVAVGLLVARLLQGPQTNGEVVILLGSGLALSALIHLLVATAPIELALNDQAGAWEAVRTAWRLWAGRRLQLFGYAAFSLGVLTAGLFLCLLPVVAALAFVQVMYVGLYAALRKEAGELHSVPATASSLQPGPA